MGARTSPRPDKARAEEAVVEPVAANKLKEVKGKKLRSNPSDEKVKQVLQALLDRQNARVVVHAGVMQATGIPLGSIERSLRNLVAAGSIKEDHKGAFRVVWAGSNRLVASLGAAVQGKGRDRA